MKELSQGFVSSKQLADLLGITRQGVCHQIKAGNITAQKLGTAGYIILAHEAKRLIRERKRS